MQYTVSTPDASQVPGPPMNTDRPLTRAAGKAAVQVFPTRGSVCRQISCLLQGIPSLHSSTRKYECCLAYWERPAYVRRAPGRSNLWQTLIPNRKPILPIALLFSRRYFFSCLAQRIESSTLEITETVYVPGNLVPSWISVFFVVQYR